MMLCSRCKKRPAVVFITAMQGEKKKNDGLCLVCAKELHVPQIDEYMKQMGITDEELEQISNQMMDMMDGESFEMGGSGVMPQFLQSFMKDPGKIFGNLKDDGEESNELQTADGDEEIPSADYTEIPSGSRRERRSKRKKELRFLGNYCTNLTRRAAEGKRKPDGCQGFKHGQSPGVNCAVAQHEKDEYPRAKSRGSACRLSPAPRRDGGG